MTTLVHLTLAAIAVGCAADRPVALAAPECMAVPSHVDGDVEDPKEVATMRLLNCLAYCRDGAAYRLESCRMVSAVCATVDKIYDLETTCFGNCLAAMKEVVGCNHCMARIRASDTVCVLGGARCRYESPATSFPCCLLQQGTPPIKPQGDCPAEGFCPRIQ